ncbi:hypothetical protein [Saccharothrix coeruleofusca]|uniref:Secreted protein n=1 Tax=Saccharothrix coeruleofusca TaxID=33919 RepID=A0A918ALI8_9PSEU|nr:hypothetical protein [Saccharothrix coeruleofusca]MBP2336422.1 hypothetical protein [Saccharothrix coeruleofusca]GGP53233.1 hypothetical protein GCM10010185_26720 [Saccharothrix coeruleofusca]
MLVEGQRNRRVLRRVTGLARSTPGRLSLVALLLISASLLAGALTALSVQRRSDALAALADRSEPLAFAAQEVHRAMADADATAASAFLSGGVESPRLRGRYEADVAKAAAALSAATSESTRSPELSPVLSTLSGQLPVYTGLVETARAHNRQGNPVGAAYLREASHLMRSRLLPAAQELYRAETGNVARDLRGAGALPWSELALGAVLLTALALAQRYLTRKTNRLLNVGLLVATAMAVVSLLWVLAASLLVVARVDSSARDAALVDVLARARIATLSARGDETLTLVARGSGAQYEQRYGEADAQLRELLAQARGMTDAPAVAAAVRHQQRWQEVHARVRAADDGGDVAQAVALALGQDPAGAATAFDALDAGLVEALAGARQGLTDSIARARGALTGAVPVVVLLALGAAAASTAGLWQRLKEYR